MWVVEKWTWRSEAQRCIGCGWYFSCQVEHENRVRCLACESKVAKRPPEPIPLPPSVRLGAKARLEDELRRAVENTARMQQAEEGEAR